MKGNQFSNLGKKQILVVGGFGLFNLLRGVNLGYQFDLIHLLPYIPDVCTKKFCMVTFW